MTSHIQNQSSQENRILPKVMLTVLLVIVLFMVSVVTVVNINYNRVGTKGINELPKVPFSSNSYILPLKHNIKGTEYKKGDLLIVEPKPSYSENATVLVHNIFADRIDNAIMRKYEIGTINTVNDNGYLLDIPSYDNEKVDTTKDNVLGRVTHNISGLGFIYSRMIGISGIVMFAVIPLLVWVLVFFVLHYLSILRKDSAETKEVNVTSSTTIRSTTVPLAKIYASQDQSEDTKVFVPQSDANDIKNIIIHNDNDVPPINKSSLAEKHRNVLDKIESADNDAVIQGIKKQNERLNEMDNENIPEIKGDTSSIDISSTQEFVIEMSADGKPIAEANTATDKINSQSEIADKEIALQENRIENSKKMLSADEILDIYRRDGKLNWADTPGEDEQYEAPPSEEDVKLETVARLYYDNDIENYEK